MINMMNCDCMEFMASVKDNAYDLAIVDPPYGIGEDWKKRKGTAKQYKGKYDNKKIPPGEYFHQLKRVSKNQIIWGYNYYTEYLGATNNVVFWDKIVGKDAFYSHGELAYSSFKHPLIKITVQWDGGRKGIETGIIKIHPHQKPVLLYKKLLIKFAEKGFKVLDTHGGSGSICIACHDLGFDLDWMELDKDYYDSAVKRYNNHASQLQFELCTG
jgi:site-specific DNA-methyltransferase (adenine-specific)